MKVGIYGAVAERANGRCECCGVPFSSSLNGRPELDHFFGRAKSEEVETCWMLRGECHAEKTRHHPHAGYWLRVFADHCCRHGYFETEKKALRELEWRHAKTATAK